MPQSAPTPVDKRIDNLERDLRSHVGEDEGQFAQLRTDIATLGRDLGRRIDEMGGKFQTQIDGLLLDKARAVGRAEGFADAKATAPKAPWWVRLLVGLAATVGVALVTGMATTIWNLEQEKIAALQKQPTSPVTVNAAPQAAPAAPAASPGPPTVPAAPAPSAGD